MDTTTPPLLLTVREVTRILRINRPKVYILIKEGCIDGFKLGSDWRIKRQSVERLVGPIPAEFFQDGDEQIEDEEEPISKKSRKVA